MSEVLQVTPKTWNKDGQNITTYWITLDDRTDDVPSYDERAKDLKSHEPLPDGWEVATSAKGKPYLKAPKTGGKGFGGQASWYNSEIGVRFVQERMDRRTALMQAVERTAQLGDPWGPIADGMYEWLRASDGDVREPISRPVGAGGGTITDPIPATSVEGKGFDRETLDRNAERATPPPSTGSVGDKPAPASPPTVSQPEDVVSGKGPVPPVDGPWGEAVEEPGGSSGAASSSDAVAEPHAFVEGRQLASGKWLCKECGKPEREHG